MRLILPIDFSIASLAVDIPVLNVLAARGAEEPAEDGAYVRNQFADDTTAAEVLRGAENEMPFVDSLPGQDMALHDSRAKKGEEAAVRLRWEHLRSVIGKKHLYEDEDGWNYYLEEDVRRESPLWDIAGALEPLLLTRYRAKERQVLENLICEETWTEQTVLFSKGRIVYQEASAPDINSIKQPALVSIAMDGSGRWQMIFYITRLMGSVKTADGFIIQVGQMTTRFPSRCAALRRTFPVDRST